MSTTGEEATSHSEPTRLDHSSKRLISPSLSCQDKSTDPRIELRGEKYWVLYNFIRATEIFHCNETITITTHGTYSFMDNLFPMLERWRGPLSMAVFAPGEDYGRAINAIMHQRNCLEKEQSELVRRLATFHIFFPGMIFSFCVGYCGKDN